MIDALEFRVTGVGALRAFFPFARVDVVHICSSYVFGLELASYKYMHPNTYVFSPRWWGRRM